MKRKPKRSPSLRRAALDPVELAEVLHDVFPVAGGAAPESVIGWFDAADRPRRVRADYANGWRVEMRLNAKGSLTSRCASSRMTVGK
ncbi:hypothetical protein DFR49_2293 [Hephaestia caeni]|uniref:Uncharacterized protein n=1 Tax=Hephaestia caeni TaxID=645617 RepID=A0A397PA53_9SPHN|nr:hypothetical protein [Hephaestia caeni]RIA44057.1 hypothetical protein DFR49_2293 [Hephaestia caeni]